MKMLLFLSVFVLCITFAAHAAVTPQTASANQQIIIQQRPAFGMQVSAWLHRHPKLQQAFLGLTKKKWFQRWMAKADDRQQIKNTVSTVALIAGILLVVSLFTVPVAALVLVPAAIICGIIGISKNHNRRSYTFALIGLILGSAYVLALAVLLALAIAWLNE